VVAGLVLRELRRGARREARYSSAVIPATTSAWQTMKPWPSVFGAIQWPTASQRIAAGFAPVYGERRFDDPQFAVARRVVERLLQGHEPYPALAIDRHWQMQLANQPVYRLLDGVDPALLEPPVNVLRLSLHPRGLAPRVANVRQWRSHLLARLAQQIDLSADPVLMALADELEGYPIPPDAPPQRGGGREEFAGIAVPLELLTAHGTLSFLSTTTVFGTPVDISLSELAIESLFPVDPATAEAMRRLAGDA